jgi:hypothetical protein
VLGLVDEVLDQTRGRIIPVLIAQLMNGSHRGRELSIVLSQLCEHVLRRHEVGVVVEQALEPRCMAERAQSRAAELAHALGDRVGHAEQLVRLLVQDQMVIAETRA